LAARQLGRNTTNDAMVINNRQNRAIGMYHTKRFTERSQDSKIGKNRKWPIYEGIARVNQIGLGMDYEGIRTVLQQEAKRLAYHERGDRVYLKRRSFGQNDTTMDKLDAQQIGHLKYWKC